MCAKKSSLDFNVDNFPFSPSSWQGLSCRDLSFSRKKVEPHLRLEFIRDFWLLIDQYVLACADDYFLADCASIFLQKEVDSSLQLDHDFYSNLCSCRSSLPVTMSSNGSFFADTLFDGYASSKLLVRGFADTVLETPETILVLTSVLGGIIILRKVWSFLSMLFSTYALIGTSVSCLPYVWRRC